MKRLKPNQPVKIIYCQLQTTRTPEKIATDAATRKEAKQKAKPEAIIAAEIAVAEEKKAAKLAKSEADVAAAEEKKIIAAKEKKAAKKQQQSFKVDK